MKFSKIELKHLILAWIGISLAFGIVIRESSTFSGIVLSIGLAAVTVGVGFLLHELSHKFLAQRYHCLAEFRANFGMILLAVAMSFFGFVFAAPGAVMIFGRITKRQNGIISMAGPLMNIILALLFLPLIFIFPAGIGHSIGMYGLRINAFLGLFNMIPFWFFDGVKVWEWNKWVFGGLILAAGGITALGYAI
jgi:Zn-dependent protease